MLSKIFASFAILLIAVSFVCAQEQVVKEEPQYAGEFFGIKVTLANYFFVRSAIVVFGRRGKAVPEGEELENAIWEGLLLSYEAFRRGITISEEELEREISGVLRDYKVSFDWKQDRQAYAKWLDEKCGETIDLFQNQISHFLQIEKLKQQVKESIQPAVSNKEAHDRFFIEYSSLNVELIQFDEKDEAEEFFRQAKANNKFWDAEKEKRPKDFKRPGSVSLAFLIDLWGFSREAAEKMLKMRKGSIHPPAPIYKGYGVFKVLDSAPADEKKYEEMKQRFFDKVRGAKQHQGMTQWIEDLKQQAKIKVYQPILRQEEK